MNDATQTVRGRPAWVMPARYAELLTRLRTPPGAVFAPPEPAAGGGAVAAWLARLGQWLCPCGRLCRHG